MEEKLDFKQMKLFIRILRMTYCFYQVDKILVRCFQFSLNNLIRHSTTLTVRVST